MNEDSNQLHNNNIHNNLSKVIENNQDSYQKINNVSNPNVYILNDSNINNEDKISGKNNNYNINTEDNKNNNIDNKFVYSDDEQIKVKQMPTSNKNLSIIQDNKKETLYLKWENVTIKGTITDDKHKKKKKIEKVILDNINGNIHSGQTLAILGSSGAGKTTLLNYLSRKIESSNFKSKGKVTINTEEIKNEDFSAISSYVMQDDILESTMTPKEILIYTAKLKVLRGSSNKDSIIDEDKNLTSRQLVQKKVKNVVKDLNIEKCLNTRIGDNLHRGISGGERKRVSIAVELLSDSPIIFLDEPTTGLDSYNAYELILMLNKLAKNRNKIVVFTIHQPASEIFSLLDTICVLALGKTVYYGDKEQLKTYFKDIQLPIPEFYNPFEHIIETTTYSAIEREDVLKIYNNLENIENKQDKYLEYIKTISDIYLKNNYYNNKEINEYNKIGLKTKQEIKSKKHITGFFYQLYILCIKQLLITLRNKKVLAIKLFQSLFISVLLALIFNNLRSDTVGIRDRLGLALISSIFVTFNATTANLLIISEDRGVFVRERSNYLYSPLVYYLSKILLLIPINIIAINSVCIVIYFATYLNDLYAYKFWVFVAGIQLSYFTGCMYALFLACMSSNEKKLSIINVMFSIPLLLLSGYYSSDNNFVPYLFPFKYLSPFKWSYQVVAINEFKNNNLNCNNAPYRCSPLEDLNFDESLETCFAVLASLGIFYAIIGFIILYVFVKIKS